MPVHSASLFQPYGVLLKLPAALVVAEFEAASSVDIVWAT